MLTLKKIYSNNISLKLLHDQLLNIIIIITITIIIVIIIIIIIYLEISSSLP